MTHADDHVDSIKDDLRKWVGQNKELGLDFFLDEGPVAAEVAPAVVASEKESAPPVEAPAPPAEKTAAPQTLEIPAPKPAPPINNPEFKAECEEFVVAALGQISKQAARSVSTEDPRQALKILRDKVLPCRQCKLAESRTQVVFGAGSAQARVMFIGEAPGRDEDLQGQPFVGASGQLLTKIIEAIGFDRRHIFLSNILKCRPPGNRDPLPEELKACEGFLKAQLAIIQPDIICCLGQVAAKTLLNTEDSLDALRRGIHFYEGIPVIATYHPAALIRKPALKRDTWNDVRRMRALYDALEQGKN